MLTLLDLTRALNLKMSMHGLTEVLFMLNFHYGSEHFYPTGPSSQIKSF